MRIHVTLTPWQERCLKARSHETGATIPELVRRAIDKAYPSQAPEPERSPATQEAAAPERSSEDPARSIPERQEPAWQRVLRDWAGDVVADNYQYLAYILHLPAPGSREFLEAGGYTPELCQRVAAEVGYQRSSNPGGSAGS